MSYASLIRVSIDLHKASSFRSGWMSGSSPAMTRNGRYPQFSFSIAIATPWPTPTHIVASASFPPRFSMPCTAVMASRAPLMPSGWPSAIAPPCGLTKSASSVTPSPAPAQAEGMAERDRPAVRVDEIGVLSDAELAQAGYPLGRERLIELD